jgi:hypothetical protein
VVATQYLFYECQRQHMFDFVCRLLCLAHLRCKVAGSSIVKRANAAKCSYARYRKAVKSYEREVRFSTGCRVFREGVRALRSSQGLGERNGEDESEIDRKRERGMERERVQQREGERERDVRREREGASDVIYLDWQG